MGSALTEAEAAEEARKRRLELRTVRSNVPAIPEGRSNLEIGGWIALVTFVLLLSSTVIFARESLQKSWPPITKLYEVLGLVEARAPEEQVAPAETLPPEPSVDVREVTEITWAHETESTGAGINLVITGAVINNASVEVTYPEIRGVLRNEARQEIRSWTFALENSVLGPGEVASFTTVTEDVPADTAEYELLPMWEEDAH